MFRGINCHSFEERASLIKYLELNGISTVFHYLSLHKSDFYKNKYTGNPLNMSDYYTNHLLRLPFYYSLSDKDINSIIFYIEQFYNEN